MNSTQLSISPDVLKQGMSYDAYKHLMRTLLDAGKTTGANQSPEMIGYTELNWQRMHRVEKTVTLDPNLEQRLLRLERPVHWLVLSEPWCGDAAASVPVLQLMAAASPAVQLSLLLRDENLFLMDQYLTDGGRGIPKLIAVDPQTLQPLYTWGPRPEPAQELVRAYKANPNREPYAEFVVQLQLWYAKDRGHTMQQEFLNLI
ncbi:MAG: thioredoxin family protein [Bacteroidetes bacterium]|nr:thioredoxin family protein [Bacteroidota bacterium]